MLIASVFSPPRAVCGIYYAMPTIMPAMSVYFGVRVLCVFLRKQRKERETVCVCGSFMEERVLM